VPYFSLWSSEFKSEISEENKYQKLFGLLGKDDTLHELNNLRFVELETCSEHNIPSSNDIGLENEWELRVSCPGMKRMFG